MRIELNTRPFPHSTPVMSKHKKMRSRLGLTISYKSLYYVHRGLDSYAFVDRRVGKVS